MPAGPEIAVAVVSWNTRGLLAACLRSLAGEVERGRAEVWVVDNGSTDGSAAMARADFPWARVEEPGPNLGFGAAVNRVAERTDTPWIAAANADTQLTPGAIDALLDAARADPGAGALAPRLRLPDGSTQHSVYAFPTLPFTAAFNAGLPHLDRRLAERLCLHGAWDPDRPRRVPWAVGAFLLLRRAAWDDAGGFDPEQWLYAEDLDLGWRLERAGWGTRYVPAAVVEHHESAAARQAFGEERIDRWQEATYAWMRRRRGRTRTAAAAALNAAGAGARWAAFAALARADASRWAWRAQDRRRWAARHAAAIRAR